VIDALVEAWNSFVFHSDPDRYEKKSLRWAAATTCRFMGQVNNGGMNSFLTYSWELDPAEVVDALSMIGAHRTAKQLITVLDGLGQTLSPCSQEERWNILEACWKDELEEFENFSEEAESELMTALNEHIRAEEAFYLELRAGDR